MAGEAGLPASLPDIIKCQSDPNHFFPQNDRKIRVYLGLVFRKCRENEYIRPL